MTFDIGELIIDCDGYMGVVLEVDTIRNISTLYDWGKPSDEMVSLVLIYSFERKAKMLFYSCELQSLSK